MTILEAIIATGKNGTINRAKNTDGSYAIKIEDGKFRPDMDLSSSQSGYAHLSIEDLFACDWEYLEQAWVDGKKRKIIKS